MIGIIGSRTTIAREFMRLTDEPICRARLEDMPHDLDQYLIAMGFLLGEAIADQSPEEQDRAWRVNFAQIAVFCDTVFAANDHARICIIGSASGMRPCYDMAYAGAKAAIHHYINTKRLSAPGQQIVGIAPDVIGDSGMTDRRTDYADCMARGAASRRGTHLTPVDVARLAHFLLCVDDGAICNVVIRMDGGLK